MTARLQQPVLDGTDIRTLAEFWRQVLDLRYRPGDEPPADHDWLVLLSPAGDRVLAFQQVDELPRASWPTNVVPQQLHLDLTVRDTDELDTEHERVLALGATLLDEHRRYDPEEPLRVYADPAGHPFCLFVAP